MGVGARGWGWRGAGGGRAGGGGVQGGWGAEGGGRDEAAACTLHRLPAQASFSSSNPRPTAPRAPGAPSPEAVAPLLERGAATNHALFG